MKRVSCHGDTASALYRVFISTFEHSRPLPISRSRRTLPPHTPCRQAISWTGSPMGIYFMQTRCFNFQSQSCQSVHEDTKEDLDAANREHVKKDTQLKSGRAALPQDHAISDKFILVVDERNEISGPHRTVDVLRRLDPSVLSLRMVRRRDPNNEEQPEAICKIVNKKAELEAERARKEKEKLERATRKKGIGKTKELELNWAIGPHDLGFKMKQMKDFLWKGYKVDLVMARKRRGRVASDEEAKALMKTVEMSIEEVKGTVQRRKREGQMNKTLKIFLEGPAEGDPQTN